MDWSGSRLDWLSHRPVQRIAFKLVRIAFKLVTQASQRIAVRLVRIAFGLVRPEYRF